ncbi:chaperonin 10-like protein [Gymnopilus junonius]|uniref:Chaperonin 10-like protein n=1 Tax=Gymnopilus junonius TaxID=109634 RepID=A0A9P5NLC4_GYMJU|nr:chaperonin 10-like protein [Gymnopilus junonius]
MEEQKIMRCIVTTGDGKFELRRLPIPSPGPNEILVKVEACAQNHTDWKSITLFKRPGNIMGSDFAGTVVALGSAIPSELRKVGQRVAGAVRGNINPNGAFAEFLVADPALVFTLPPDVPFEIAAQLGVSCYAACQALYQTLDLPTPLQPATTPEDILIWSGSSSMGQYTVQFAKLSGLRVISTASPRNFELVRSLGAEEVLDYADSKTPKKIFSATAGKLRLAVDCISDGMTPVQVSGSLSKAGGTVVTVLPYESKKKGVKTELILVYSMWGEDVEHPIQLKGNPQHYENATMYNSMISEMLAKNMLKFGAIKVFPNGLASVQDGMEYMMSGKIHAEKIIYKISDTPDVF